MNLFADYHTHTGYARPEVKVRAHILAAKNAGLREVGITNHGPNTISTRLWTMVKRFTPTASGGMSLLEEVRDTVFDLQVEETISIPGTPEAPSRSSRRSAITGSRSSGARQPDEGLELTRGQLDPASCRSSGVGQLGEGLEGGDGRDGRDGDVTLEGEMRGQDVTPLAGVEANVISGDGDLDVPSRILDTLDVVLVGMHRWIVPGSIREAFRFGPLDSVVGQSRFSRHKARASNTKALVEAVMKHRVDIVTHPGLGFDIDTHELARACAKRNTALEINSSHGRMTIDYVRIAAKEGSTFAISSDAHSPSNVGNLKRGIAIAERAGLLPEQVINADDGKGGEKGILAKSRKRNR